MGGKQAKLKEGIESGSANLVREALEAGANPFEYDRDHQYDPLGVALKKGNVEVMQILVRYLTDHKLPSQKVADIFIQWIDSMVNKSGMTPSEIQMGEALLGAGANINEGNLSVADYQRVPPLFYAIAHDKLDLIDFLIRHGASAIIPVDKRYPWINDKDKIYKPPVTFSPLTFAFRTDHFPLSTHKDTPKRYNKPSLAVLQRLLQEGPHRPDVQDSLVQLCGCGPVPLELAAEYRDSAQLLINHGAEPTLECAYNCAKRGHYGILSTLLTVLGSQDVITLNSLLETALTNHPEDMACKETQDHATHTTYKTSPSMLRQKICQVLLDAGADPWQCLKQDTPWRKSNQGFKNIPLWCVAAARDDPSLLKMLLSFESKNGPCKDSAHQFLHCLSQRRGYTWELGYPQQETL